MNAAEIKNNFPPVTEHFNIENILLALLELYANYFVYGISLLLRHSVSILYDAIRYGKQIIVVCILTSHWI